MLSIANDLASRLHQAIILSSEQHATNSYYATLRHTCKLFSFVIQNIFNASSPGQKQETVNAYRWFPDSHI
jgi:hypothetical protein